MVEQLARQHSHLEEAAHRQRMSLFSITQPSRLSGPSSRLSISPNAVDHSADPVSCTTSDDDENEFFDAQELSGQEGVFSLSMPANVGDVNGESSSESDDLNSCETEPQSTHPPQVRASRRCSALISFLIAFRLACTRSMRRHRTSHVHCVCVCFMSRYLNRPSVGERMFVSACKCVTVYIAGLSVSVYR